MGNCRQIQNSDRFLNNCKQTGEVNERLLKASFSFENAQSCVLSTEWKVQCDSISTVMDFIHHPQIKYLGTIVIFLGETFHNKRGKKPLLEIGGPDMKDPEGEADMGH